MQDPLFEHVKEIFQAKDGEIKVLNRQLEQARAEAAEAFDRRQELSAARAKIAELEARCTTLQEALELEKAKNKEHHAKVLSKAEQQWEQERKELLARIQRAEATTAELQKEISELTQSHVRELEALHIQHQQELFILRKRALHSDMQSSIPEPHKENSSAVHPNALQPPRAPTVRARHAPSSVAHKKARATAVQRK